MTKKLKEMTRKELEEGMATLEMSRAFECATMNMVADLYALQVGLVTEDSEKNEIVAARLEVIERGLATARKAVRMQLEEGDAPPAMRRAYERHGKAMAEELKAARGSEPSGTMH